MLLNLSKVFSALLPGFKPQSIKVMLENFAEAFRGKYYLEDDMCPPRSKTTKYRKGNRPEVERAGKRRKV